MNALHLAICGDHPDVVKMLVDEFNVALMIKSLVSSQSHILNDVIETAIYKMITKWVPLSGLYVVIRS